MAELELPVERNVLSQRCVSRQALQIVAQKWLALVVFALVGGPKRHSDLQRMIEGVSQKMLTQTLRQMEERGLITRTVVDPVPPRARGVPPDRAGESLGDPLVDLCHWAMEHAHELGVQRDVSAPSGREPRARR